MVSGAVGSGGAGDTPPDVRARGRPSGRMDGRATARTAKPGKPDFGIRLPVRRDAAYPHIWTKGPVSTPSV
ncbi:hypothetical protein GCM10023195_74820 [Actinoallomurus liliacearum]|uniref:Uncharacterized protein n=1 Tax=Actinoallomurus liliacearum TaxID=1080073 RepID=A0ABP8TZF6_9ACTN